MLLNELCDFIIDCPHSTAEDEGKGYPLIRTPNIGKGQLLLNGVHRVCETVYMQRNSRGTPQDNDLIFAREAPAGNVAIIKNGEKVCLGQRTVLIRPNPQKANSVYLTYYLLAPEQQYKLVSRANGSTVAHVNLPTIRNLRVNLPELSVQNKVASILSTYDDLIEKNNRKIAILQEQAQEIYKEWFVRFRFPGYKTTKLKNGLPVGWEYKKLQRILKVYYGKNHSKINEGLIPIYGSGGIMRYGNKALYDGESVLIPRKGSLNHIMWVNGKFWTVDTMFYTKALIANVEKYLFYMLSSLNMESYNSGAALPSMTTDILYHLKILIPTDDLLKKFNDLISNIYDVCNHLNEQNTLLTQQRDLLLPRLMSGKLEVH